MAVRGVAAAVIAAADGEVAVAAVIVAVAAVIVAAAAIGAVLAAADATKLFGKLQRPSQPNGWEGRSFFPIYSTLTGSA